MRKTMAEVMSKESVVDEGFERRNNQLIQKKYDADLEDQEDTIENYEIQQAINPNHFQPSEVIDENLSLEKTEINLIKRALEKHKGKRKNAAEELGISERTLYRKIKEYNLNL